MLRTAEDKCLFSSRNQRPRKMESQEVPVYILFCFIIIHFFLNYILNYRYELTPSTISVTDSLTGKELTWTVFQTRFLAFEFDNIFIFINFYFAWSVQSTYVYIYMCKMYQPSQIQIIERIHAIKKKMYIYYICICFVFLFFVQWDVSIVHTNVCIYLC